MRCSVALSLLALGLSACARHASEQPVAGDVLIEIPSERIPVLIREAQAGDLSAAATLVTYYGALELEYRKERREWMNFGAIRGDCNSIALLSDDLHFTNPNDAGERARIGALARKFRCEIPKMPPTGK